MSPHGVQNPSLSGRLEQTIKLQELMIKDSGLDPMNMLKKENQHKEYYFDWYFIGLCIVFFIVLHYSIYLSLIMILILCNNVTMVTLIISSFYISFPNYNLN